MNIAKLNERVVIQENTVNVDRVGNHINTWTDYFSCHATVSAESPKENTEAGVVWDDSKIDFTLRWCDKTAAITSTGFRLLFRASVYEIIGVDHMNFKRKAVKLHCRRVER